MKNYKTDYEKHYIGTSDIASLLLVAFDSDLRSEFLNFGKDGSYYAYVVDEECEIPEHYTLKHSFKRSDDSSCSCWLKIYDDDQVICQFRAAEIKIYRAGEQGAIVQLIKKESEKWHRIAEIY